MSGAMRNTRNMAAQDESIDAVQDSVPRWPGRLSDSDSTKDDDDDDGDEFTLTAFGDVSLLEEYKTPGSLGSVRPKVPRPPMPQKRHRYLKSLGNEQDFSRMVCTHISKSRSEQPRSPTRDFESLFRRLKSMRDSSLAEKNDNALRSSVLRRGSHNRAQTEWSISSSPFTVPVPNAGTSSSSVTSTPDDAVKAIRPRGRTYKRSLLPRWATE